MDKQDRKERVAAYKEVKQMGGICSITHRASGRRLVVAAKNLRAFENRFAFSQATGSCPSYQLSKDWAREGAGAFEFEILDQLEPGDNQTSVEFGQDLDTLLQIWLEKFTPSQLY